MIENNYVIRISSDEDQSFIITKYKVSNGSAVSEIRYNTPKGKTSIVDLKSGKEIDLMETNFNNMYKLINEFYKDAAPADDVIRLQKDKDRLCICCILKYIEERRCKND